MKRRLSNASTVVVVVVVANQCWEPGPERKEQGPFQKCIEFKHRDLCSSKKASNSFDYLRSILGLL
jgi:hypothetical protein